MVHTWYNTHLLNMFMNSPQILKFLLGSPEKVCAFWLMPNIIITEYFKIFSFQVRPTWYKLSSTIMWILIWLSFWLGSVQPISASFIHIYKVNCHGFQYDVGRLSLWHCKTWSPDENTFVDCLHFWKLWLNSYL